MIYSAFPRLGRGLALRRGLPGLFPHLPPGGMHNSVMPNIASSLKADIARVARKQIKAQTGTLKSATSKFRSVIANLKRQIAILQRQVRHKANTCPAGDAPAISEASGTRHRSSPARLASHLKRLVLSAEALDKLIGVSGLSIYKWEAGKARPQDKHLPAISSLRTPCPRQAAAVSATR
jgi:DNA-binding transcriptional regulator YiaG